MPWTEHVWVEDENSSSSDDHGRVFTDGCSPSSVHRRVFTVGCSPTGVHHRVFTVGCSPTGVHQRVFTVGCSPTGVHRRVFIVRCSPSGVHRRAPLTTFVHFLWRLCNSVAVSKCRDGVIYLWSRAAGMTERLSAPQWTVVILLRRLCRVRSIVRLNCCVTNASPTVIQSFVRSESIEATSIVSGHNANTAVSRYYDRHLWLRCSFPTSQLWNLIAQNVSNSKARYLLPYYCRKCQWFVVTGTTGRRDERAILRYEFCTRTSCTSLQRINTKIVFKW